MRCAPASGRVLIVATSATRSSRTNDVDPGAGTPPAPYPDVALESPNRIHEPGSSAERAVTVIGETSLLRLALRAQA